MYKVEGGEKYRYVFAFTFIKKISCIHKNLEKLIVLMEKIWMTGRLSLYTLMFFMSHENVLFTRSKDHRRKVKKAKRINTALGSWNIQAVGTSEIFTFDHIIYSLTQQIYLECLYTPALFQVL